MRGAPQRTTGIVSLMVGRPDPAVLQDFLAQRFSLSRRAAKAIIDGRSVWVNRNCVWMAGYRLRVGDRVELPERVVRSAKAQGRASSAPCRGNAPSAPAKQPAKHHVHRLDRDTTWCLLFATDEEAFRAAVEMFKTHRVAKTYHAIAVGRMPHPHEVIDSPIDGQPAVSRVTREAVSADASFLRVRIETGRTNQIRRHLASIRFPIVGDRTFGLKSARDPRLMQVPRQMLHASSLERPDPLDPRRSSRAHSPLPADFRAALRLFGMGKRRP